MRFIRRRKERLFTLQEKNYVACTFQAQKFRSDGTITYQGPVFSNLILNVGLDLLASAPLGFSGISDSSCRYVNVGEDNTDPATNQSGLLSHAASTDNTHGDVSTGYNTDPCYKWVERTFEFSIGSCTGNLTEVGLSKVSNDDYFNRQLFRDNNGDPTTITVLEDEGLRITVRLYFYSDIQPGDTVSSSFTLSTDDGDETIDVTREMTSDTDWLTEFAAGDQNIGYLGTHDADKSPYLSEESDQFSGGTLPSSLSLLTYSSGDYYRDVEATWNAGKFIGDIASVHFLFFLTGSSARRFTAFRLNPVISVEDTEEFTMTIRRAWARY